MAENHTIELSSQFLYSDRGMSDISCSSVNLAAMVVLDRDGGMVALHSSQEEATMFMW